MLKIFYVEIKAFVTVKYELKGNSQNIISPSNPKGGGNSEKKIS